MTPGGRGSSPAPRLHRPPSSSPSLAGPPPPRLRSPLVAGLSPAAAGASRLWGHRTRLHPLDRAPPPPAAGLTPRLSPLGPGELAVERRGRATAGESCSSASPSPLADPSVLISTAGEKTHKLCYGGWFIRTRIFFVFDSNRCLSANYPPNWCKCICNWEELTLCCVALEHAQGLKMGPLIHGASSPEI